MTASLLTSIEWTAAAQASRERRQALAQVEATHDLDDLLERFDGSHEETVRDVPSLEQAAVAGEHDAMLGGSDGGQLGVVEVAVAQRVEADQAQEAGQLTQVDVDDEARIPQRRGPEAPDRTDVERFEHGIDGEAIAVAGAVREPDRLTVDDDEIDLGVRDAGRFDDVLHRLVAAERPTHGVPRDAGGRKSFSSA